MDKIEIKQATIKDLDTTYSIVHKASKWLEEKYNFKHWSQYYTFEKVKENFEKKTVYLLYENSIPVATYTMSSLCPTYYSDIYLNSFANPKAKAYYLTTICVIPSHQGKGYAKMMINDLEKTAKKDMIKYVRFDARADYMELIEFYKKMGYKTMKYLEEEDDIPEYLFEKAIK